MKSTRFHGRVSPTQGTLYSLLVIAASCSSSASPADSLVDGTPSRSDAMPLSDAAPPLLDGGDSELSNFLNPGPFTVTGSAATESLPGCTMNYSVFAPDSEPSAPLILLGHGFNRSRAQMEGLGSHLASWGMRVVTPDFCHSSILDTDHNQNGIDLAELGSRLGGAELFAGHSAGGLAAVVASKEAGGAVPVLGLDPVDADDIALTAATSISAPVFFLMGESSSCNATSNALPIANPPGRWAAKAMGATHCDFEDATGFTCTIACGAQTGAMPHIKALSAAFAAWQLALAPSGQEWAHPSGSEFQRLAGEGILAPL